MQILGVILFLAHRRGVFVFNGKCILGFKLSWNFILSFNSGYHGRGRWTSLFFCYVCVCARALACTHACVISVDRLSITRSIILYLFEKEYRLIPCFLFMKWFSEISLFSGFCCLFILSCCTRVIARSPNSCVASQVPAPIKRLFHFGVPAVPYRTWKGFPCTQIRWAILRSHYVAVSANSFLPMSHKMTVCSYYIRPFR